MYELLEHMEYMRRDSLGYELGLWICIGEMLNFRMTDLFLDLSTIPYIAFAIAVIPEAIYAT
jgi:hypothetical protein